MPLDNLVCGLLEAAVNKLHRLDSSAQQRRNILAGVIVGVRVKELNKPLYFIISRHNMPSRADNTGKLST